MRTYLIALTTKMSEHYPQVQFVVVESRQFPLTELSGRPNVVRIVPPGLPSIRSARVMYQNLLLALFIRTLGIDAWLATCNVLPFACSVPSVVVVQSLQYFDHAKAFGRFRAAYLRAALRYACKHATSLICVSDSARRRLIALTGVSSAKVNVIYHGISPDISAFRGSRSPATPPYILCVATLYKYKNIPRLIEAFAEIKLEMRTRHRLRIIGGEADVSIAELQTHADGLGVGDEVDLVGSISHEKMPLEYARASAFVYPSLSETFGHPPLEAMLIGVPVVAANAGSIPEIVGDAAELVDPVDVHDIARGLKRVLLDRDRATGLVRLGFARAREFSWDASAKRTMYVIQSSVPGPLS